MKSTARGRCAMVTITASPSVSISPPARASRSSGASRYTGSTPSTRTDPRVIAAAYAHVPADDPVADRPMRRGRNRSTPSMVIVPVPAPSIRAPIWPSIVARSMISGSRAALSITVMPSASTAAIRMFSVAPTLGKVQTDGGTVQPARRADHACRARCSSARPSRAGRTGACPAGGSRSRRRPAARPSACRHRPISGPSTHTDARSRLTAGKSARDDRSAGVVMVTVSPSSRHVAAQPAQHVRHQRDVQDLRAVGDVRRALGQQRRGHELEHTVLGPGHLHGAGSRDPPVTRKRSTPGTVTGASGGLIRRIAGCPHGV